MFTNSFVRLPIGWSCWIFCGCCGRSQVQIKSYRRKKKSERKWKPLKISGNLRRNLEAKKRSRLSQLLWDRSRSDFLGMKNFWNYLEKLNLHVSSDMGPNFLVTGRGPNILDTDKTVSVSMNPTPNTIVETNSPCVSFSLDIQVIFAFMNWLAYKDFKFKCLTHFKYIKWNWMCNSHSKK